MMTILHTIYPILTFLFCYFAAVGLVVLFLYQGSRIRELEQENFNLRHRSLQPQSQPTDEDERSNLDQEAEYLYSLTDPNLSNRQGVLTLDELVNGTGIKLE